MPNRTDRPSDLIAVPAPDRARTGVKIMAAAAAVLVAGAVAAASPASTASAQVFGGNVSIDWTIDDAPSAGLDDITFPMTIHGDTAHVEGLYFAQQFEFTDGDSGGYTGLQPRADIGGQERLRAVFSSFQDGATSDHENCSDGADGGEGVSCGVEFDANYDHTYELAVTPSGADTWTGTVIDTVTGDEVEIGEWTMPSGSGLIVPEHGGFVEYYDASEVCSELERVDVTFGAPTSTTGGGISGETTLGEEYGACTGEANFDSQDAGDGVRITRGWTD